MIKKDFFLAKDNYRIGAQILRENKILRDHAVAVELLPAPPAPQDAPDPDAIALVADTDKLMTMCSCAASSDNPY